MSPCFWLHMLFAGLLSCAVRNSLSTEEIVQIALLVVLTTLLVAVLFTLAVCYLRYGEQPIADLLATMIMVQLIYTVFCVCVHVILMYFFGRFWV